MGIDLASEDPDGFSTREPVTIIREAFKLIKILTNELEPSTMVMWSPVVVHNALYSACLECLGGMGAAYARKPEKNRKRNQLESEFKIELDSKVSEKHFMLTSSGGNPFIYPIEFKRTGTFGGRQRTTSLFRLEWKEVTLSQDVLDSFNVVHDDAWWEAYIKRTNKFTALDFWSALTRVCDSVYMGHFYDSQPLHLSEEDVGYIDYLTNTLRNPTAHVQPNASTLIHNDTVLEVVKATQAIILRICSETRMSHIFTDSLVGELEALAI